MSLPLTCLPRCCCVPQGDMALVEYPADLYKGEFVMEVVAVALGAQLSVELLQVGLLGPRQELVHLC